jgi:hypothetical protein
VTGGYLGDGHPVPRRGSQLGRKASIALLLIAEAGGTGVRLRDIPATDRHFVNSKGSVLADMGLVTYDYFAETYTLTGLGSTAVELLRAGADS